MFSDEPFLLDHEIAVVIAGHAVAGLEQIAAVDVEADRLFPEVPAFLVPDADREAEGVGAFGQRQRTEPADEVLLIRASSKSSRTGLADAEADDLSSLVEQFEFDGVGVFRRASARPEMDLHHVARVEVPRQLRRRHCAARRAAGGSAAADARARRRRRFGEDGSRFICS